MNREIRAHLNVLIAEPNEFYRRTYKSILHSLGFKRVKAEINSADAMQAIRMGRTDLLIVGDKLTPQNGCAFVAAIRHMGDESIKHIPIVLITDKPDVTLVRKARDVGVNEILANPVSAKAMEARVLSAIENPRAFVEVENYVGPDRRRRRAANYKGPDRRRLRGDETARNKTAS
jgi:PleD family two-component response regulator